MRYFLYGFLATTLLACSPAGEQAVLLADVSGYASVDGLPSGKTTPRITRGTALYLSGSRHTATFGRTRKELVLANIAGHPSPLWIPERETLPGGLVETRLHRGFFTNVYLTRRRPSHSFPVSDAPTGKTIPAGTGLIVVARRGDWYRAHWADSFCWIRKPGFASRPFTPPIQYRHPSLGPIRITSGPWRVPSFGEERRHSPDRLFESTPGAAWVSKNSGKGDALTFSWKSPVRFRMRLINGYAFSPLSYKLYNRLARCRISVGSSTRELALQDHTSRPQPLGVWRGNTIRLEMLQIHPGQARNHLALQQLEITVLSDQQ